MPFATGCRVNTALGHSISTPIHATVSPETLSASNFGVPAPDVAFTFLSPSPPFPSPHIPLLYSL